MTTRRSDVQWAEALRRQDQQRERQAGFRSQSVEDILRPLAEATRECPGETPLGHAIDSDGHIECGRCGGCGYVLDPRFESLRLPFIVAGDGVNTFATWGDIDASLGAIVRAAAACGYKQIALWTNSDGGVACSADAQRTLEFGATPEEAAARALVAAVGDHA